MNALASLYYTIHNGLFLRLQYLDGIPLLALRIYLAFPFYMAGATKISGIEDTAAWFGNPDWGLGLPFPTLMAYLAAYTEFIGAILLVIGLAVRWISIPLIVTMLVATFAVHWDNGWFAIAQSTDPEIAKRLSAARSLLEDHGNISWLTEKGSYVILQNGIEFAVTYLVMLLVLLCYGGGRYVSVDYYLARLFPERS
ncbi:MAG: DoxX family protein [Pseudomonadota bacterium]